VEVDTMDRDTQRERELLRCNLDALSTLVILNTDKREFRACEFALRHDAMHDTHVCSRYGYE
jgi:hypothetical protein